MARVIQSRQTPQGLLEFTLDCRCELVVPEHLVRSARPREIEDVVRHCAERHVCPADEIKRMRDPSPKYLGMDIKSRDMRADEWLLSWEPPRMTAQQIRAQQEEFVRALMAAPLPKLPRDAFYAEIAKEMLKPPAKPAVGFTPPAPPVVPVAAKAPEPEPKKEDRPKDRFDLIELD